MKKVKKILIGLLVFSIVALCFILDSPLITKASSDDENSRPYVQLDNVTNDPSDVYDNKYQDNVNKRISKIKQRNNYTFENPLLIENPYGTNTTGIYMYFTTDRECQATYTIKSEGYADFTRTLNPNTANGYTKTHEYLLVGSIPGVKNTITVTLKDLSNDQIAAISWTYQAPDLLGGSEYLTVATESFDTTSALTNGLYTVLGNDVSEDSEESAYMRLYDNYGIIRSEIPIISYRSHRVLFDDNAMYFSISSTQIVCLEQSGYVSHIYDTGDYKLHHDYIFDNDNNLLVLASKKMAKLAKIRSL